MQVKVLAARQQKIYVYKFVNLVPLLKIFSEFKIYISVNSLPLHYQWRRFISQHFSREDYCGGKFLVLHSEGAPSKSLQQTISGVIYSIFVASPYI
jgi:hypothetical protein